MIRDSKPRRPGEDPRPDRPNRVFLGVTYKIPDDQEYAKPICLIMAISPEAASDNPRSSIAAPLGLWPSQTLCAGARNLHVLPFRSKHPLIRLPGRNRIVWKVVDVFR